MFKIDYTFIITLIGFLLLATTSGLLSGLLVIKKETLVSDVVSHSTLPGIIVFFLLFNSSNYFILSLGALFFGLIALFSINKLKKYSKIDINSLLVIVLSIFMGLGFVLLSVIRKNPSTQQAGIESYLFGQAVSINIYDVIYLLIIGLVLMMIIISSFKEIKMYIFDPLFMESTNYKINIMNYLFIIMIILTIISQIQMIGIIFTAAMLTIPGLFAIQWANSLKQTIVLSVFIAIVAAIISCILAVVFVKISMGACCIFILALITIISLVFKKKRSK